MGAEKVCSLGDTVTYTIYRSPNCTQQYTLQADAAFATVVAQTATAARVVFRQNGTTSLKAVFTNSCRIVADSISVTVRLSPVAINLGADIMTCRDTALLLHAGSGFATYLWQDGSTDSTLPVKARERTALLRRTAVIPGSGIPSCLPESLSLPLPHRLP